MIAKLFSNTSTENVRSVSATETLNDIVSEHNSYDTDEESDADEAVNILGQSLYFDGNVEYFLSPARDFILNVVPWSCQRGLNEDHVNSLFESIKRRKKIIGTFKVIRNIDGEVRCIDGQHRTEALKKIMENNAKFNCNILVEVYDVEDFESEEANEYFKDANCVLNMVNSNPNTIVQSVLKKLDVEYPGMFVDVKEGQRCNRPRINRKSFVSQMSKFVMNYDEDVIVECMKRLNNKIGMWSNIVREKKVGKFRTNTLEKVKENGFYIGLYSDFKWVDELELDLLETV